VLITRNYCGPGVNWMIVLIHLAMDCSLLAAKFQDLRFGIIFTSKIKTFVGRNRLNSSLGSSTHNSFQFIKFLSIHNE
jgi:hypothetical protein